MTTPRAAWLALACGLAIQFGVPAWKLTQPRPQRFGWQMYSTVLPAPTLVGVRADGDSVNLDRADFLAFPRADLPTDAWRGLPAHVCRVRRALVAVRYRLHDGAPWQVEQCR